MLKRHRPAVELPPHDVVELILERLDVMSLLRFKSVSKKWKSTIESPSFKERQLIRRRQSRGPDVLFVSVSHWERDYDQAPTAFGSSTIRTVKLSTLNTMACHGSCDGLVCLFSRHKPNIVVNPATRWHRSFALSSAQQLLSDMYENNEYRWRGVPNHQLGFGKDKFRGTYKPVWLCNSSEFDDLDKATTTNCEVFDFSANAWRYVLPASPYRILDHQSPVYFDGSLYWLTACEESKVLSFDLHTETFQVICKAPFPHVPATPYVNAMMCILDNRLCVSHKNRVTETQVIWSFGGNKTWKKMCSIDFTKTFPMFPQDPTPIALPIAILEKNKLLFGLDIFQPLVIHDLHTKSYDLVFTPATPGYPVCYFQSPRLFSVQRIKDRVG